MTAAVNPLTQQPYQQTDLQKLIALGNETIALEAEIAILEAQLAQRNTRLNVIKMQELPAEFSLLGMSSFNLENGTAIEIKDFYSCSLGDPKKEADRRAKALKWLRTSGNGGLIKHEVYVAMQDSETTVKALASLRGFLNKKQLSFTDDMGVHAGTLKAFMKEQIAAGKPFPLDIFKGFVGKIAKITTPETKK